MTAIEARPRQRRAGVRIRAVLGGAAAAWLGALVLLALLPLGVAAVGDGVVRPLDVVGGVAAIGWLAGLVCAVFAPIAGLLAAVARRLRGGAALACGLVGAAGGIAVDAMFYGSTPPTAALGAVLGAASGGTGWAGSQWARRSTVRVVALLAAAPGIWGAALLTVIRTGP